MTDGYIIRPAPTLEHFLSLIEKRKPGLTDAQRTEVANEALAIFNAHSDAKWMHPMLAVKMALAKLGL